jgi:hypothetical protein
MEPHHLWLRSCDNRYSLRREIGPPRMIRIVGKPALARFSRALLVVFIGSGGSVRNRRSHLRRGQIFFALVIR